MLRHQLFPLIHKFTAIPIKIPASYLVDMIKLIVRFMWRHKRPRIADAVSEKNKVEQNIPSLTTTIDLW